MSWKRAHPLCLLALGVSPLFDQERAVDIPTYPPDPPVIPHANVVTGRDDPDAVPLHVPALLKLYGLYGSETDGLPSAVDRFAQRYDTDRELAGAMVTAVRQVHSEIEATNAAQRRAFCARSFADADSWKAAAIAFDAYMANAQEAALDKLREVASPELWETIVREAREDARSVVLIQQDYDSIAAEIGYETAFSNQCR